MQALIDYFRNEWHVLGEAPATFIMAAVLVGAAVYWAASWRFGGVIASQRAQIELLERKVAALPGGADFITSGLALQERCLADRESRTTREEAEAWFDEVRDYLKRELGEHFVIRFENDAGAPQDFWVCTNPEASSMWHWLNRRLYRLDQFMSDMT